MHIEHDSSILKDFTPSLQGKVALVTGASRGIGKAIAVAMAARGATLVLHARNDIDLGAVSKQINDAGGRSQIQKVDAKDEHSVSQAFAELLAHHPEGIDILVNNAGIFHSASVKDHSTTVWDDTIRTNLYGPFFYARAAVGMMLKKKWGRIINISSISGRHGEIHAAAYSASKFGLIGFTQSLALETAADGITVNAVCPGWVETDMSARQLHDENWCNLSGVEPDQSLELAKLSVPQMRFIQPYEVAELVVWLCTDAARGVTGQSINICGGMCLS